MFTDSGAEMLQSLRIETRENSLVGFQNDHCYTPLKSPSQSLPQNENVSTYDDSVIQITHTPPPKPVPISKKITVVEQQPKGKKIIINSTEPPVVLKGNDVLHKPLPVLNKSKDIRELEKVSEALQRADDSSESSSISSSGDSIPDRDSDSDYKDTKDRAGSLRLKKNKLKPRILKTVAASKISKQESNKLITKVKPIRHILRKDIKEKLHQKNIVEKKVASDVDLESLLPSSKISTAVPPGNDLSKVVLKQTPKPIKKEKKTPAHVTALLSDMTSLFSTPDVIRRVSTDGKGPPKTPTSEKESLLSHTDKKPATASKVLDPNDGKVADDSKVDTAENPKPIVHKTYLKPKERVTPPEKAKPYDLIPQIDDASLAQILQDTTGISNPVKSQPSISTAGTMNSPGLAGPLSPTLDLLGGLQPEEEGLTEDFLMSVAQLVASSENLQEVIDKQVLGKVDSGPVKTLPTAQTPQTPQQQIQANNLYTQTLSKSVSKTLPVRKDPIEIVRRDGRVITLPPIEAPATRSSKRKSQMEMANTSEPPPPPVVEAPPTSVPSVSTTPEPHLLTVSKQYTNKKLSTKKQEQPLPNPVLDKVSVESQESWNSEDDPNRYAYYVKN